MVVDLREIVEHNQLRGHMAAQDQLDGVVQLVHARRDDGRFGLGDDRQQL
jgi:hypothetical protein